MLHSKVRNTSLKDRTDENRQRHNKEKKICVILFKKHQITLIIWVCKKVCDKKKWKEVNPLLYK